MNVVFESAKGLYYCVNVVKGVLKEVRDVKSPIHMRNLSSHNVEYVIEIMNTADFDIRELKVEIIGEDCNDCFWDNSSSINKQVLFIDYIYPNSSLNFDLLYIKAESTMIKFHILWKDWRGKIREQTIPVHLKGWSN